MSFSGWLRRRFAPRPSREGRWAEGLASAPLRLRRLEERRVLDAGGVAPGLLVVDAGTSAGDGSADTYQVDHADGVVRVLVNGQVAATADAGSVSAIRINGSADDDVLLADLRAGVDLVFDGAAGNDSVTLDAASNAAGVSYSVGSDNGTTVRADFSAGEAGVELRGVESVVDRIDAIAREVRFVGGGREVEASQSSRDASTSLTSSSDAGRLDLRFDAGGQSLTVRTDGPSDSSPDRLVLADWAGRDARSLLVLGDGADSFAARGSIDLGHGDLRVATGTATVSEGAWLTSNGGAVRFDAARLSIAGNVRSQGGAVLLDSGATGVTKVSGTIDVSSDRSVGGLVHALGRGVSLDAPARIDASGALGGGTILVGGEYLGSDSSIRNALATQVAAGAVLRADAVDRGAGGRVIVWADGVSRVAGTISARGGRLAGDGGFIETSGKGRLEFSGAIDASAPNGAAGTWLIDPHDVVIVSALTVPQNFNPADPFQPTIADAGATEITASAIEAVLTAGTNVRVLTTAADASVGGEVGNISVNAPIAKSAAGNATLTLQAAGSIVVTVGNAITSSNGQLSVVLIAGLGVQLDAAVTTLGGSFTASGTTFTSGVGGTIDTDAGTVTVNHTGTVTIGGTITTATATGDVSVTGTSVTVDAQVTTTGGDFTSSGTTFTSNAGGTISTAGGNVLLNHTGSVAFGAELNANAGIVRITASGNVSQTAIITASALGVRQFNVATGNIDLGLANVVSLFGAESDDSGGTINFRSTAPAGQLEIGFVAAVAAAPGFLGATGARSTNGAVTITSDQALAVSNAVNSGTGVVRITANGNVTQTAVITAATLGVRQLDATTGDVNLGLANAVSVFAAQNAAAGGVVNFRSTAPAGQLTVGSVAALVTLPTFDGATGVQSNNGVITLTSDQALAVNNAISAGTDIVRITASGNVTQTAVITASALGVRQLNAATGNVDLGLANAVSLFAAQNAAAGGFVNFRSTAPVPTNQLTVGSVVATLAAPGFLGATGVQSNNGAVRLASDQALVVNEVINAGTGIVRITASGDVTQTAVTGTITASQLGVRQESTTVGAITLTANNPVGLFAASNAFATGAVGFRSTQSLTVGEVAADGSFATTSGVTTTSDGAAGGNATLFADVNAAQNLTLDATVTAPDAVVTLNATGSILDDNDADEDIVASRAVLVGAAGIGTVTNFFAVTPVSVGNAIEVQLSLGELSATTTAANSAIHVTQSGELTFGPPNALIDIAGANNGVAILRATGAINATQGIVVQTGDSLGLIAGGVLTIPNDPANVYDLGSVVGGGDLRLEGLDVTGFQPGARFTADDFVFYSGLSETLTTTVNTIDAQVGPQTLVGQETLVGTATLTVRESNGLDRVRLAAPAQVSVEVVQIGTLETGTLTDDDTSVDVVARVAILTVNAVPVVATSAVGTATNPLGTRVDSLSVATANAGATGNQFLTEVSGLTALALTADAAAGVTLVVEGGSLSDEDAGADITAGSANITVNVGSVGAGVNAIGTNVNSLTVTTTANGSQFLVETNDLNQLSLTAAPGAGITLNVGGSLSDTDPTRDIIAGTATLVVSGTVGAAANRLGTQVSDLSITSGSQFLDELDDLANINLNAGAGAIDLVAGGVVSDLTNDGTDVSASALVFATTGFGVAGAGAIDTSVANVEGTGGAGAVAIINSTNLTVGGVGVVVGVSAVGSVSLATSSGSLTVNEAVASTAGSTALAAGSDLITNAATTAGAAASLSAGGNAVVGGAVTAGTSATLATGINLTTNAAITSGGVLSVDAGGSLTVNQALTSTSSDVALTSVGDLATSAAVTAGAAILMSAGDDATVGGAVVAGASATLTTGANLTTNAVVTSGGALSANSGGSLAVNQALTSSGANVALRSTGVTTLAAAGDVTALRGISIRVENGALAAKDAVKLDNDTVLRTTGATVDAAGVPLVAKDRFVRGEVFNKPADAFLFKGSAALNAALTAALRTATVEVKVAADNGAGSNTGVGFVVLVDWRQGSPAGPVKIGDPAEELARTIRDSFVATAGTSDARSLNHVYDESPETDPAANIRVPVTLAGVADGTITIGLSEPGSSTVTTSLASVVTVDVIVPVLQPLVGIVAVLTPQPFKPQPAAPAPAVDSPVAPPPAQVQTVAIEENSAALSVKSEVRYYELRVVSVGRDGLLDERFDQRIDLSDSQLKAIAPFDPSKLPELFRRLPGDRYRIYLIEDGAERLVIEFVIERSGGEGRPVELPEREASDEMGADGDAAGIDLSLKSVPVDGLAPAAADAPAPAPRGFAAALGQASFVASGALVYAASAEGPAARARRRTEAAGRLAALHRARCARGY
ncbi:MAG: beta strand repeat-containing protein [Lacipirellulaceae bacterium]